MGKPLCLHDKHSISLITGLDFTSYEDDPSGFDIPLSKFICKERHNNINNNKINCGVLIIGKWLVHAQAMRFGEVTYYHEMKLIMGIPNQDGWVSPPLKATLGFIFFPAWSQKVVYAMGISVCHIQGNLLTFDPFSPEVHRIITIRSGWRFVVAYTFAYLFIEKQFIV